MKYDVPFFANHDDDLRCFQASLKMMLKYFLTEQEFTWQELDTMTARLPDLYTWPMAGLLWLEDHGFDVRSVEAFDYQRFIKDGEQYLIEEYGEEVGRDQITKSDLTQETRLAKLFLQRATVENRVPQIAEIEQWLNEGYLVGCMLNARKLNGKDGYYGHSIVVVGYDDNSLIIHDPGLPPCPNRPVPKLLFEEAWAYPNDKAKTCFAVKLKKD